MLASTAMKNNTLYLCCEGRVKTYEEYLEFAKQLTALIATHIDEPPQTTKPPTWKLMLFGYPFNTYALGHILRLKLHSHYDFALATNNYRLLELLESVEFHKIFSLTIEHDPRS